MTGRELLLLLYDNRVSQTRLADRLGVTRQTVNKWVHGETRIPPYRLEEIRRAVGEIVATPRTPPRAGQTTP